MTESSDPQLQLKKRARRRLVGAVAFAGLAAVVLPMVMDEEPKPQTNHVQIKIPGQDPLPSPARETTVKGPPGKPLLDDTVVPPEDKSRLGEMPLKSAPSQQSSQPPSKSVANAVGPVARTPERSGNKAEDRKPVKSGTKTSTSVPEKKGLVAVRPLDKTADKDRPLAKKAEKPPVKPAPAKKVVRGKAGEKASEKSSEKASDKTADDNGKPASEDAQRVGAILSGKSTDAAVTKSPGKHVIVVGAFANPQNARQLQSKLGGAGVTTYTESLSSPDGTKTRVRAGPFPTREAAERALEQMKRMGITGVVAGRQ